MAVTFTGIGTGVAASGAGTGSGFSVTLTAGCAVGDYLVVLMAYDNSGGGGADPISGTIGLSPNTMFGASVSAQTGHNDPGAASAGLAVRCVAWPVTTAFGAGAIGVTWSGTVTIRAVAFMKVSSNSGGIIGYRTNSGTGLNGVAVTTRQHSINVNDTEGVLFWAGHENGAAITGDADTTFGTWSSVYGAFQGTGLTGMAAYFQSKVVTATNTQSWDPTGTSSDWIIGCLIFTETPVPAITQAAYQFFDDTGTESGAAALAAQNTAVTGNLANGDGYGQIRVRLQSTTAVAVPSTDDFRLQWEKNASGTWNNVGEVLLTSYDETNRNAGTSIGNLTSSRISIAQSFVGNGSKLSRAGFHLQRNGSPDGNLTAVLYAHTGTFGTTGTPTGTALATSTARPSSAATSGSYGWVYFDFDKTFTLVNGTNYCIAVLTSQTLSDAANINVGNDSSSPTAAGSAAIQNTSGGAWSSSSFDLIFSVYTDEPNQAVVSYDSPTLTESAATTNRLTGGTGTFTPGKVSEVGNVINVGWSGNNYTEILFSVKLTAANLLHGDTLRFRVVRNGSTTSMTYSVTPTVNISAPPLLVQEGFRWRNDDGSETTATWKVAQDTNTTTPLNTSVQLRVLVDASGIPLPSAAKYTLYYKKSTDSTWLPVPLPTRVIGNNIVGTSNLLLTNTATCNGFPSATGSTYVARTGDVVTEVAVYGADTGQTQVAIYTVSAGLPGTLVGSPVTVNVGASPGWYTASCSIALTAGVEYTTCLDFWVDQDWTVYRDLVANSWSSSTTATSLPGTWTHSGYSTFRYCFYATVTTSDPVYIAPSSNVAASGEPTTAQLTAPAGETTVNFSTGRMWDDENGTDILDIGTTNFTPAGTTGLALWLDASDASTFTYSSGSVVSQWNDKSTKALHVSQGTVANQPTRTGTQNGLSTVVFADATDIMSRTGHTAICPAAFSIFCVFKKTGAVAPSALEALPVNLTSGNASRPFDVYGSSAWIGGEQMVTPTTNPYPIQFQTEWVVYGFVASDASDTCTMYRNGVSVWSDITLTTAWTTTTQGIYIGARGDAATTFLGEVAEIVVYETVLTALERRYLDQYLRQKWRVY